MSNRAEFCRLYANIEGCKYVPSGLPGLLIASLHDLGTFESVFRWGCRLVAGGTPAMPHMRLVMLVDPEKHEVTVRLDPQVR